jgi:chromosome segregation ATPase
MLKNMISGLEAQLEAVGTQVQEQQRQQAAGEGSGKEATAAAAAAATAAVAAAQVEAVTAKAAAVELQVQLESLNGRVAAAVAAAEAKESELRFLQRQFEQVTEELHQQQQQVGEGVNGFAAVLASASEGPRAAGCICICGLTSCRFD